LKIPLNAFPHASWGDLEPSLKEEVLRSPSRNPISAGWQAMPPLFRSDSPTLWFSKLPGDRINLRSRAARPVPPDALEKELEGVIASGIDRVRETASFGENGRSVKDPPRAASCGFDLGPVTMEFDQGAGIDHPQQPAAAVPLARESKQVQVGAAAVGCFGGPA
jgi:hypothetical protein